MCSSGDRKGIRQKDFYRSRRRGRVIAERHRILAGFPGALNSRWLPLVSPTYLEIDMRRGRFLSVCLAVLLAAALSSAGEATAEVDSACGGASFAQDMLATHNQYRAQHGAPNVVLDPAASASAQKWADNLARTEDFVHSKGSGNGENLAAIWGERHTGFSATKAWYDEIKDYDFDTPTGFSMETGHFTQVVWKASTKLGVGVACNVGGRGGQYVVAHYNPGGNMTGNDNQYFRENVQRG